MWPKPLAYLGLDFRDLEVRSPWGKEGVGVPGPFLSVLLILLRGFIHPELVTHVIENQPKRWGLSSSCP